MSFRLALGKTYHRITSLSFTHTLAIGVCTFLVWAFYFHIDQSVTAHGQIISEDRTQLIQAVDGGVLLELKVREGQAVKAGEVLAVLQKYSAEAGYAAAVAELDSSKAMLTSINDEFVLTKNLLQSGDVGYLEVARIKRQLIEMQGRVDVNQNKLNLQKIVLDRTNLTSPVDGNVKLLKINTIGGVVRAGDEIMEISPLFDGLLIEVRVNPADIGSLKVGLPAIVKLDAFDYSIYGSLSGTVTYISPDTLSEQVPGGLPSTLYRVHVQVPPSQLSIFDSQHASLKLGMSGTVDIKTGSRSILRYILKPIYKGFEGALHEK